MSLSSLPAEILISICDYLTAFDFVSLTSTNKALRSFYYEPTFWRKRVRSEFRIPPQPLLESDGKRWEWLYRSLVHSSVYTWGNDNHGNLGRPDTEPELQKSWPNKMSDLERVGAVADVQCGGWSTVLLNSKGQLYAAGVMDGERLAGHNRRNRDASLIPVIMPMRSEGEGLLDTSHRSVSQFSMGRKRLLALSDEGEVIEWDDSFTVAGQVLSVDALADRQKYLADPKASQVVAGWQHSSAYFPTQGLRYWKTTGVGASDQTEPSAVNMILARDWSSDVRIVPGTKPLVEPVSESLEERIGNVKKYLVLENHIILLTETGKLFSWEMTGDQGGGTDDPDTFEPTELTTFYEIGSSSKLLDIQGSFRKFATFSSSGDILICSLDNVTLPNTPRFQEEESDIRARLPTPQRPSVLQDARVIQLAFGDHHYHALHVDGTVTSHGIDPDCCGALGFGSGQISFLRGVDWRPRGGGDLLVNEQSDGKRTVWFEPEKFVFLSTMLDKFMGELRTDGPVKYMAGRRGREFRETYAEWFETEGRNWSSGPERPVSTEQLKEETIAPYFALKITAAGWSSAAVVLVDENRAEQIRQKYLLPEHRKISNLSESVSEQQQDKPANSWGTWLSDLWSRTLNLNFDMNGVLENETPANYCDEASRYVWSTQRFPILRMSGVQIDEKELSRWKDGEPRWLH